MSNSSWSDISSPGYYDRIPYKGYYLQRDLMFGMWMIIDGDKEVPHILREGVKVTGRYTTIDLAKDAVDKNL